MLTGAVTPRDAPLLFGQHSLTMLCRLQKSAAGSGSPGGGGEGQEGRGAVARPRASLFVPLPHGDSVQEAAKAAVEEAAEEEEGDEGEAEGDSEEGEEPKVPTATSDNRS